MSIEPLDLSGVHLVDHHVHGALSDDLTREQLELNLTESDRPSPVSAFDSQVGLSVRRWCAPVLDLPPLVSADEYAARRRELGAPEVNRRLLASSGIDTFLLETGYRADEIYGLDEMAQVSGARVREVVRIESVMDELVTHVDSATALVERFPKVLQARSANAVGLKSIVAYRYGLDFQPGRPDDSEVVNAAARWMESVESGAPARVADPVLLRFGLWSAVDLGLPLQLHTGYGDPDLELHRCDPLLLTSWLRAVEPTGVQVLLLHCYPFHRNAGYLAQVFPHVYLDVGLAINYLGLQSNAVIAESLELAPFGKVLFSTDAWGPAELHYLGALLWRRGMSRVLSTWVADGECARDDAMAIARMIGGENARRVYRLSEAP